MHVATHCTEADTSPQHMAFARKLGMDTTGFLMMAHLNDPAGIARQGKLMESYGAQTIYVTDSAGYMLPEDVTARILALREVLKPETEIGFHGHHNLGMGIANSIAAVAAGASRIDGSVAGLGAGAGNAPLEVFAAVCERMGIGRASICSLMDVAEDLVVPMMDHVVRVDRDSLTLGFCRRLFHLPAPRQTGRPAVRRAGAGHPRGTGPQEDDRRPGNMITDTAMTMARPRGLLQDVAA